MVKPAGAMTGAALKNKAAARMLEQTVIYTSKLRAVQNY